MTRLKDLEQPAILPISFLDHAGHPDLLLLLSAFHRAGKGGRLSKKERFL
jgi:hypothetical protein